MADGLVRPNYNLASARWRVVSEFVVRASRLPGAGKAPTPQQRQIRTLPAGGALCPASLILLFSQFDAARRSGPRSSGDRATVS